MSPIEVDSFLSFNLSIILLFIGKACLERIAWLQRYSIPEPVVGGFLCASVVSGIYFATGQEIVFDLGIRDWLLVYFFAGIGLKSDIRKLISGGKPMLLLTLLAAGYIVLQNLLGIGIARGFGMNPLVGLMSGSISLVGGVGTALAWAPTFADDLGIANALEIGVACNTVGLIAACCIGGPIAAHLMKRHGLQGTSGELDVGIRRKVKHAPIDSYDVLWSWLWLNVALICGYFINQWVGQIGFRIPLFVSCLMAGILIRNTVPRFLPRSYLARREQALALISDISLGMFLTMALMGIKVWELQDALLFVAAVMAVQIVASVCFTSIVVFNAMGKNYESAVISAGFGGISLGSTATAIVNMTAVTKENGPAHQAFIIVPLVCGFFVDLINAFIVNIFVSTSGV